MINNSPENQKAKCGIYVIRNLINNKRYIGQSRDLQKRITMHKSLLKHNKHQNIHMQRSYNLYGDVFSYDILEICNPDDLGFKEEFWISYFDTTSNAFGYNETSGGDTCVFSNDTILKMSKSRLGKKPANYCMPMKDKQRTQIAKWAKDNNILPPETRKVGDSVVSSEISLKTSGSLHYNYGKHLSAETKQKLSASRGHAPVQVTPVEALSIDGKHLAYYENMSTAARINAINVVGISRCVCGGIKSSFGCVWKRVDKDSVENITFSENPVVVIKTDASAYVVQMHIDMEPIAVYNSALCASIAVNRSDASLRDALNGRSVSCAGFKWKYISVDEYLANYSGIPIVCKSRLC